MEREKLIQARTRKHWTQEEAAAQIGVDSNTVYRWERGLTMPRGQNLRRLCEVYEVAASELGLEGQETTNEEIVLPTVTEKARIFVGSDLTMRLFTLAFTPHRNFLELQDTLTLMIEEHSMKTNDDAQMSRRDALRRLAMLPFVTLRLHVSHSILPHPVGDILTQCAASVAACWELSKRSDEEDLTFAFKGVEAYLPTLVVLARDSSPHQKAAASLAGQCSLLKTMLGWHLEGLREAAIYAQDAVVYARESEDIPLLLSALDYQAWLYHYSNRSKQAQSTIEQALPILKEYKRPLPSRLLGGVYSTIALMRARNGQRATTSLRQAAEAFFDEKDTEHRFVYMDYTKGDLILNDGMVHYQQREYNEALDSLGQLIDPETLHGKIPLPERSRLEGLNSMTMALLKGPKKDMEYSIHCWQAAIQGAKILQSEQRFSEALVSYEVMESLWPGEKRISSLRDLAVHW